MLTKEDVKRMQENIDNCYNFGEKIGNKIHSFIKFFIKHLIFFIVVVSVGSIITVLSSLFALFLGKQKVFEK